MYTKNLVQLHQLHPSGDVFFSQTLNSQLSMRQSGLHDPFPAHTLHLGDQFSAVIQRLDLVAAADAFAVDEDVRHRAAARALLELVLQARTEGVLVELGDEGRGGNLILGEEDRFGFFRVRAVGFGEDYDCEMGGEEG